MQILGVTAPTSPTQSPATSSTSSDSSNTSAGANDQLTKESTFLQLLVSQIKNQDPLNPTDSVQFVGQLVQFSQLEQLLGLNKSVDTLVANTAPPVTAPPSTGATQ